MAEQAHQSFTELEVWKKARAFKNDVFELTKTFPSEEKFRLCDQLIRASRSINSNIAEGHGRFTFKDQLHFCIQARGSLSECFSHLIDAYDLNLIGRDLLKTFKLQVQEIEKLLNGYIAFLRKNI
jgi:four helix bundle protein